MHVSTVQGVHTGLGEPKVYPGLPETIRASGTSAHSVKWKFAGDYKADGTCTTAIVVE
jgi:hypothetical protein